jgi:ABC-2 type transport system ATP-binding protein
MNIIQPDSGSILFNEQPLKRTDYLKIGYLPEERGLYQKMKLRETIVYLGKLKGLSKKIALERCAYFLERFSLQSYVERKIEELSRGNQQKVQFIISVLHQPELIILDEPFSGLDPVNQLTLKEIIKEFHDRGATIILSTHQMEQVEKLCSQICLINQGRRILSGNLDSIKRQYGNRKISIQYQGEAKLGKDLETIKLTSVAATAIEGEIYPGKSLNDVLKELIPQVSIVDLHLEGPSLEQIFIEQVGQGDQS